ncbi:major facilitator superfamily transporter monocarboxylic acid [Niveomyces insectorum RCEF 264]|uniref:Probable transporter MCH1 n=1 Tax=Niveomyces insectorum RCEF 264 TaxID=1081102 RepID=A0A167QEJ7_9HYPO|nr:major facilitator superfamily transporter monocarboxylic acid [Niveomyces insectorum RCEF 264]
MSRTSSLSSRSFSPNLFPSLLQHRRRRRDVLSASATSTARAVAFVAAIVSALCAGSITVFSLYGHIFQERLRYSQFQVNGLASAATVAMYLPVSLMGYVCDRSGPAPLSLLSSIFFGVGYSLAAFLYKRGAEEAAAGAGRDGGGAHGPVAGPSAGAYALMVAAFVFIGVATCAMYLGAVTTCAKNFGRGRHRGLALAMPIAAFGLSGMWQSQFASRVLYERRPPLSGGGPPRRGDVDVFAFFVFLAVLLSVVGLFGTFTLRVVDEDKLIEEAAEELERSGLLDGSALFSPSASGPSHSAGGGTGNGHAHQGGYGTMGQRDSYFPRQDERVNDRGGGDDDDVTAVSEAAHILRGRALFVPDAANNNDDDDDDTGPARRLLDPAKDRTGGDGDEEDIDSASEGQAQFRKTWVLNEETRRFLTDHTMWLLTMCFFLMIGPGEAFINNMGTVIQSLYPPATDFLSGGPTTAATHVSIVGISSTIARLLTGTLTDLLAPRPQTQHLQVAAAGEGRLHGPSSLSSLSSASSLHSELMASSDSGSDDGTTGRRRFSLSISRVVFLLFFGLALSAGLVVLATGATQNHGERFWIASALVGAGYGAVFSLTPIIITVIWGVENFGTNWGIVAMFPALGATLWGLVYSAVYQARVGSPGAGDGGGNGDDSNLCYGTQCYAPTFWAMAVSVWLACLLVLAAWKGHHGWAQRGIVI